VSFYHFLKQCLRKNQLSPVILMYHRIAEPKTDPWELSVSDQNFEEQLQVLKQTGLVIPLHELTEQIYFKARTLPSIVITFDDGYADNYLTAKPLLEKYKLPATFFISSQNINTSNEFWWDELAILILQTEVLPKCLTLKADKTVFFFDLQTENILSENSLNEYKKWSAYGPENGVRSKLYLELWKLLSPLQHNQQQQIMQDIRNWAGKFQAQREAHPSMSQEQLLDLSTNPLFTIGSHTVSHPALAFHERPYQYKEILENKIFLENLIDKTVDTFSYPSNSFNELTIELLKEFGFRTAFTTTGQPVRKLQEPFRISRFQVNNWTGVTFSKMLNRFMLQ
jgi:peptidoglycan/xylan/chitin deacetylase (PgdA/CDA1 family)